MSKIRILPEILSNKIAAGEVVERPASVVKELIENAIDAGSTKIIVEIENGGRSLIRVSDNGHGMDHDDALLAIERYATSKIINDDDLFAIRTLGFRGEALPSIASVSRFELITKTQDNETGTKVKIEGGKIKDVQQVGAPTGTMITVRQLFFNVPARRKFLKTISTETGHIIDTIASIALGWPDIQFEFIHNSKPTKNWPVSINRLDRVLAVLGNDLRNQMHALERGNGGIEIKGWISSPAVTRSTSQKIHIYVNGRYIRDRGIQHALLEGYRGRLMKGRFPLAVLFIRIPYDQLDVNVHPTKHEVRFAAYQSVYNNLKQAVEKCWDEISRPRPVHTGETASGPSAISTNSSIAEEQTLFEPLPPIETPGAGDRVVAAQSPVYKVPQRLSPERPYLQANTFESSMRRPPAQETPAMQLRNVRSIDQTVASPTKRSAAEADSALKPDETTAPRQSVLWETRKYSDLRVIGQFFNTYIVCESAGGLVLIDQHAAHERIVYEQLKKRSQAGKAASVQRLLIPETIDLGYREAAILEKLATEFNEMGFEIEPFGGHTFVIKSVPALLADKEIKPLILEIVDKIQETGVVTDLSETLDACLIIMACHGALRARQGLSETEMRALLNQLEACDNATHCPHGRPICQTWSLATLEKSFKRIV